MVDFDYLYKGLCGLARAHRANGLAGHLGAALVAGYFFGEDHADLDRKVYKGIEKELDRVRHGDESLWFDPKKSGITVPELFVPFPKERPRKELTAGIATALAGNIGQTRQSGHNVIFAALAIRALSDEAVLQQAARELWSNHRRVWKTVVPSARRMCYPDVGRSRAVL